MHDWFAPISREGLRTRYQPKSRIYSVFFTIVPWFNVALLAFAYIFFLQRAVHIPGPTMELPTVNTYDGIRSSIVLAVRAHQVERPFTTTSARVAPEDQASVSPLQLVVFLEDCEYDLTHVHRIASLQNDLRALVLALGETEAILYVDEQVTHAAVLRLAELLRVAGLTKIGFAATTPILRNP